MKCACGDERKLYHPCPVCGQPTFKDRVPEQEAESKDSTEE